MLALLGCARAAAGTRTAEREEENRRIGRAGVCGLGACRDDRERNLLLRSERQMRNGGVVRFDATLVDEQSSSMLGIGPHQRGPAPPLPAQIFSCPVRPVRPSRDCALSLDFMAPRLHGLRAVPPRASMDRGRQGPRRRSRCAGCIPWRTARGAGQTGTRPRVRYLLPFADFQVAVFCSTDSLET